jgi:hypothetical protein
MTDEQLEKWFFEQKNINESNCWEWNGVINSGSGQLSVKGKRILAHRFSLQLHIKRIIPKGTEVRHMCNNPICINPEHLKEGTHYENMQDMVRSNRQAKGKFLSEKLTGIEHIKARGAGNSNVKLTEKQVIEIKTMKETISKKKLSDMYGVSSTQISRIHNGESWSYLNKI